MRNGVCFFLLLILLPASGISSGGGMFWKIVAPDGHHSYLFGTMHSEDPAAIALAAKTYDHLDACDLFAMEIVPDFEMMMTLAASMKIPDGQPDLEKRLGKARFQRLADALLSYGISRLQLLAMRPWAAYATLSFPKPVTGEFVDLNLLKRAYASGLDTVSLETVGQQLAFFLGLEPGIQIELIDSVLDMLPESDELFAELLRVYVADDLDHLAREADKQLEIMPAAIRQDFKQQLLTGRNSGMLTRILPLLETGCVFIAVGALHLPGETGLIALVRQRGYKLVPLPLH